MKVQVLYSYDKVRSADAAELNILINQNKILAFRRASGWVKIGTDPIRGDGGEYFGPERRNIMQKSAPVPEKGFHYCLIKEPRRDN